MDARLKQLLDETLSIVDNPDLLRDHADDGNTEVLAVASHAAYISNLLRFLAVEASRPDAGPFRDILVVLKGFGPLVENGVFTTFNMVVESDMHLLKIIDMAASDIQDMATFECILDLLFSNDLEVSSLVSDEHFVSILEKMFSKSTRPTTKSLEMAVKLFDRLAQHEMTPRLKNVMLKSSGMAT